MVADGYSSNPIIPKEKYEPVKDGKLVTVPDILVVKSGSGDGPLPIPTVTDCPVF